MRAGDVVIAAFPGAKATKARPAVVVSSSEYHLHRPDVILGLVTTRPGGVLLPTDCEIQDWKQAGLHSRSFFRLYLVTLEQRNVRVIGRLTQRDWNEVQQRMQIGLAVVDLV